MTFQHELMSRENSPAMSWCLILGCTLPLPICSWDRLQHPLHDPAWEIEVKGKK